MGTYKKGKQTKAMTPEEFKAVMEKGPFKKGRTHRAFLAFLYWTGCRISEALQLTRENFVLSPEVLTVHVPAVKKGIERGAFLLRRNLPYVDYIVNRVERTRKGRRVFPFSRTTGWNIVKRVLPDYYPHYFRLNRCVHFLNKPDVTLDEIRQWFAWNRMDTMNSYLGYSERTTGKLSERLE